MEIKCQTLTVPQAAKVIGIGRNTCYKGIIEGKIPCLAIGKRYVVPVTALERYLAMLGQQGEAG